jgi:hypothetical protein
MATMLQMPSAIGTRWVATVAALAARLEPSPRWVAAGWVAVVLALVVLAVRRVVVTRRAPMCEGVR